MSKGIIKAVIRHSRIALVMAIMLATVAAPLQPAAAAAINANGGNSPSNAAKPAPTGIAITSPANGTTVVGTQTLKVSITGSATVTSVQYKLDGSNLGSPVTTAPYSLNWDTATAGNASHKLTAVAISGKQSTTSAAVTVTVNNPPPPPITSPTTPPTNTSLSPAAKVSFTFDDGLASTYTNVQPILAKYGLTGTDYVITGCVGMTTVPNTCHANTDTPYMSWNQVETLQNDGWEIGSHTVTHPYLATSDATDGQPNVLTPAQVTQELVQSKADLAAHGINATDFSTPYGDYNNAVLAQIAKYYASQRGFADQNNNDWPAFNDYIINDYQVEGTTTVAQVEAKIDDAIANHRWLVLTMHNILPKPSTNPDDYEWGTTQLDQVAAYVKAKQDAGSISSVHVNQGPITSSTNLLPNGSFNNGIADGWTTDSPATVTADSGTNGSYPDPAKSIKLGSAATGSAHLFSPKVAVTPGTTYILKNFLNLQNITSGSVGFYIDEYDANGNWISGQYKKAEPSAFVENMNFSYLPSSARVATASLQIIVGGTGITAYLDNSQWFPSSLPVNPPPAPTLLSDETFDNGIANGWTTDGPVGITADSASNNGSPNNPVNSVKAVSTANTTHLFGPKQAVDSTKQYTVKTYVKLQAITSGSVGFYIDEYDANGNWISGQYKTDVTTVGAGDIAILYTPSSANVKSASLQIIIAGNSGVTAYIDDVRWYLN
jgi:peptidoglycan/xylan/chitin deacetylase (PgdA/CDA1 family)